MNIHSILDEVAVRVAAISFGRPYFADGIDSPALAEQLAAVRFRLPSLEQEGIFELVASTISGGLDPAVRVARWVGPSAPTFVYHHGTNEAPYDRSFNRIFLADRSFQRANLLAVRAPYHRSTHQFMKGIRTLSGYGSMLATSVRLVEALVQHCLRLGCGPITVAGISLGGFVANMNHAFFNSADHYRPLLAGAAMDHTFLDTSYRRLVHPAALAASAEIRRALNFETDYSRSRHDNVSALLAAHDRYVAQGRQRQCYGSEPITVLDRGHLTAALSFKRLRQHIIAPKLHVPAGRAQALSLPI